MSKTEKRSTAATNVASQLFSISFCNIRGLSSNINPVHHHLPSINSCALFLTEAKIKPLNPNDITILYPHLKCPGYELFSSFFPNGGVCAFICSNVQTLHLKQFDLSNPGLQLFWLKVSLPRATKYICTLYHSPNSETMNFFATTFPNQLKPSLFSLHALKSLFLVISTYTTPTGSPIPLMSPTLLVGKLRSLPLLKALTQVISEPTRVPDCAGDKANSLDLFLTSNPSIYSPPTVSSPLGNSDHCLITLRHDFLSHLDRPFAPERIFHYDKADWDSLRTFTFLTTGLQAFQMILPPLLFSSPTQYFLAWIFSFPLLTSLVKNSPKWLNSQCANAVNNKKQYFKERKRLQTQQSRTSFIH